MLGGPGSTTVNSTIAVRLASYLYFHITDLYNLDHDAKISPVLRFNW